MKRILATLLALAMVFALCACGQTASQPTASEAPVAAEPSAEPSVESAADPVEIDYPTKEITLLVPFNAGGSSDIFARLFAEHAKKYCDQPFVVVNQGGGGGVPATTEFLSKPADGYSIEYAASAPTCTQSVLSEIPYSVEDGIDYLCQVTMDDLCIVVRSDCPANNMDEFVEWVKNNDLVWGSSNGGVHYFASLAMMADLGISATYVPTDGGSDSIAKLLGSHVDYVTIHPAEVLSSYTSGETKIIGIMSEERCELLPDVPTFQEQGYDYLFAVLKGFIVRPGMDPDVRAKLLEICKSVLEDEEFIAACKEVGVYIQYKSGEEYKAMNLDNYKTFKSILESVS